MPRICVLAVLLALVAAVPAHAYPSGRPSVSLDGRWQFRLAPDDRGDAEQWYSPATSFADTAPVPGCWEAAGVGAPTDKMWHHAIGVGWYRRTFTVPQSWAGRRVWLVVGGAHRFARVWVNGRLVGEHWGYPTAFRIDITEAVRGAAAQDLVIAVDSRRHKERDTLIGAFDLIDYMDVDWGGIFEHVSLETTGGAWIDEPFVQPDPARKSASVTLNVAGRIGAGSRIDYAVREWRSPDAGDDRRPSAKPLCAGQAPASPEVALSLALPGAPLWSPASPRLLVLDLTLTDGGRVLDRRTVRFGLRRLEVRGADFYLNGDRFFLSGYGDDWNFPLQVANLPNVAAWNRYLALRHSFGFNGVRHHSTMPPDSYLDAADEVGMLIQPELPIAYEPFFKEANERGHALYRQVWSEYICQMRNHPSVFAWCMGNEQYNGFLLGPDLYRTARTLDPTRPAIDTDGLPQGADRPTLDYHSVQFDEWSIPWGARLDKYRMAQRAKKPVIVHEMSNISVLPDPADIPKYRGAVRPFWLQQMADAVRTTGQSERLPAMLDASRRLQASLLKLNIEGARLSQDVDGHHQWLFRDYWTQATGFVNQFDEVRAITPAYARQFLGPAVLLWDRDRAAFRPGEVVPLKLYLSDFRPRTAAPIRTVAVECAGRIVQLQAPKAVGGRGLIGPWTGAMRMPATSAPARLSLTAAAAGSVRNEWPIWVFPAPAKRAPSASSPLVVRWLSPRVLDRLEAGAAVVLFGDSAFPTMPARFKPAWWHGDDTSDHCYGNLFSAHPALRGYPAIVPTQTPPRLGAGGRAALPARSSTLAEVGHYMMAASRNPATARPLAVYGDIEAAAMLDNRPVVLLDEVPGHIEPIAQCIDVPWRMRRKAYVFEARVGKGKLLVCTLNLSASQRERDPAAAWVYDRLLRYAAGAEFQPSATIPAEWLRKRLGDVSMPEVDTWVEGFSRVQAWTGEPQKWYSYREDNVTTYPVRQTDGKQRLTWTTAPVPANWSKPTVTFAWAGGIGWETDPAGGHFGLLIDGKLALDFPFTTTSATWTSPNGQATLRYVVRRNIGPDSFGLFLLTVPASSIAPGKPVALTVTASSANSKRWFSLVPYRDVAADERGE